MREAAKLCKTGLQAGNVTDIGHYNLVSEGKIKLLCPLFQQRFFPDDQISSFRLSYAINTRGVNH